MCNNFNNIEFVDFNYLKEKYSYRIFKFSIPDFTDDIIYRSLYKIELLFIFDRLKTKNFKIVDIEYLKDNSKNIFVRLVGSEQFKKVHIPPLDIFYEKEEVFCYKNVYHWQTKKGIRKFVSDNDLYNYNEKRKYKIGDVNKYGHILKRITRERFYVNSFNRKSMVGLNFN